MYFLFLTLSAPELNAFVPPSKKFLYQPFHPHSKKKSKKHKTNKQKNQNQTNVDNRKVFQKTEVFENTGKDHKCFKIKE